jgi:MFS family permease
MTAVAVPVQVYSLTHSSLAVGLIGLPLAVPLIALGLIGGSIADAVDRRALVLVTSVCLAVVSLALAAQAALHTRQVWLLYALVALQSSFSAIDSPARRTFVSRLLPVGHIRAASALSFLSFQVSVLLGPLVVGVLIARAGLEAAYALDAATFLIALYGVARLPAMQPEGGGTSLSARAVLDGLRFVAGHSVLGVLFLADINATVFGFPRALFPALAATHFGGLQNVGLLYAAVAAGGALTAAFSGPLAHFRRQGLAVLSGIALGGASFALFSLTSSLPLALCLLALAGVGDVLNGIFRTTITQVLAPHDMQGRANAAGYVVGVAGPDLGDIEAGSVASLTSPVASAVIGGVVCVVGVAAIALLAPTFRRFRLESHEST